MPDKVQTESVVDSCCDIPEAGVKPQHWLVEEGRKHRAAVAAGTYLPKVKSIYKANWVPELCDMTKPELERIRHMKTASVAKRACALLILDSLLSTDPKERRASLKEMIDRTEGKAIERSVGINLNIEGKRTPAEVLDELNRLANYGQPG